MVQVKKLVVSTNAFAGTLFFRIDHSSINVDIRSFVLIEEAISIF